MDDSSDRGDGPADRDKPGASADGSDDPDGSDAPVDDDHDGAEDPAPSDDDSEDGDVGDGDSGNGNPRDADSRDDDTDDAEEIGSDNAEDVADAESVDVADAESVEDADTDDAERSEAGDVDGTDSAKGIDDSADPDLGEDDFEDIDDGKFEASDSDDIAFEGPESDEEMPLADHIEEMVRRLAIVFGVAGVVTLIAYPASAYLIEFLWQSYIPDPNLNRPHIYGPLEYVLTKLKVAGLSGTIVGLPVFVYQTYRFMKPGLYTQERRYYLASVPTSLVLAIIGVVFAHLVILPLTMVYFTSYTADAAVVAFGLQETFNLIVVMMGYMAIVFQIPLFIMLAIMMGLVSREWMEDKRILFWGAFGGLAFTFVSVDPTGMAPIIIAVTMIVLFEGTLLLLRWTGN